MQTQEPINPEMQEQDAPQASTDLTPQKDYFSIALSSILGGATALTIIALCVGVIIAVFFGIQFGYNRWFSMDNLVAVGNAGYYYDAENHCFIDPTPHRRVIKGCTSLQYAGSDTIGIVQMDNDKYRYLNLNTLSFLNDHKYDYAYSFHNDRAMALIHDTLYYINPQGEVINSELSNWLYLSITPLTYSIMSEDEDGYTTTQYLPTNFYLYEDINHAYGLMSCNFTRLTQPLFSDISALTQNVFLCEYEYSEISVLVNQNGEIIK